MENLVASPDVGRLVLAGRVFVEAGGARTLATRTLATRTLATRTSA